MSNFIEKILRKVFSIFANAFMTVLGIIFFIGGIGGAMLGHASAGICLSLLGAAMAAFGTRWFWQHQLKGSSPDDRQPSLPHIDVEALPAKADMPPINDFTQECYEKAVNDYNELNTIIGQLSDESLFRQLNKMQSIASKMIIYMKEHPEKISLADQFINYYQDRALTLSKQFLEFEQMQLNTPDIAKIKAKTITTLESFDEAYEAQFSKMLSDKVMEMESELKVAEQIMSDSGIKNRTSPAETVPPASQTDFHIERPFDTAAQPEACHYQEGGRPRGRFQH